MSISNPVPASDRPALPKVQPLAPHTINQIAAGEVVERPVSVVKELVENALDAGARRIQVLIEASGKKLIEVSDDGHGMAPDDAQTAMERHATSKIRSLEDLQRGVTLGFRGEALPSIASVSLFELSTGTDDTGRFVIEIEGGTRKPERYEAGPKGTTVRVAELFFNTPARLKFLKSDTTEMNLVTELIGKYAVSFPDVSFRLIHESTTILDSPGDGDRLTALASVWGRETVRALAEISSIREGVRVRGFVSPPHVTRPTRSLQWAFVNGRPVKNRSLLTAIDVAFRQLTPERRFPLCLLLIDIDPARVDINVSPSKSEARFQNEGVVFDAVRSSIKDALMENGMVPSAEAIARANKALMDAYPASAGTPVWGGGMVHQGTPAPPLFTMATQSAYGPVQVPAPSPEVPGHTTFANLMDGLRIFGQTEDCTFILAENNDGILIIDQHVAHERILYEMLRASRGASPLEKQPLLTPIPVELDRAELAVGLEQQEPLFEAGFEFEPFGNQSVLLRTIPAALKRMDPVRTFRDLLSDLADGIAGSKLSPRENVWVMCSCKLAIKAGDPLTFAEMEKLIVDLAQTENPYLCPHGRPITILLSRSDLLRKFKRA